jgi:TPR repeat protein
VSLLQENGEKKASVFPYEMNKLLKQLGLLRKQKKLCTLSTEVVGRYSNDDLDLHPLTPATLSRMLNGGNQDYTQEKVLTFYLTCRYLDWKMRGRLDSEPVLSEAFDFYNKCVRLSGEQAQANYADGKEAPTAGDNANYDEFNLQQRRRMDKFGPHGLDLSSAVSSGDANAALYLGILHILTGGLSDARRCLVQAAGAGSEDASAMLDGIGSGSSRELAARLATKIARSYRQAEITTAILYFELAAANENMDAAYYLGDIYEERGELGECARWFTVAETLGHLDAQRRVGLISAELDTENNSS